MQAKDGLVTLERSFAFKICKITGEATSADQEAVGEFPRATRKSLRRKDIFLKKFLF